MNWSFVVNSERIPTLEEEPLWMKLNTTAPCAAGCAMFRDIRAWHVSRLFCCTYLETVGGRSVPGRQRCLGSLVLVFVVREVLRIYLVILEQSQRQASTTRRGILVRFKSLYSSRQLVLIGMINVTVLGWWWVVAGGSVGGETLRDMPREVFDQLSAAGKRCCRNIVSDKPVITAWTPDWIGSQGGGSIDNQLHNGEVVDDPWNTGAIIFHFAVH